MIECDVVVIGGGPAGLAAAVSAKEHGAEDVLVVDRNSWLGGILPQCIHDGFGVEETGVSLTGPEYAEMYIDKAKKLGVNFMQETMVLHFNKKLVVTAVNKHGLHMIKAKSIVLATGCREKTRWTAMIPGDRPSGVFTAGAAQTFINLYNIMPGKRVVILGSGDVGLIMARRLKLEGVEVVGVVEILPYTSGLPRNVVQCLEDYGIPLYLKHTISCIRGRERLKSVTIAEVDEKMNLVPGTEKEIECDTLLLSMGLIPENELSKNAGVKIDERTCGPIVNQFFETTLPGVFACGNCLQVYDTVDVLSRGAKQAGIYAAEHAFNQKKHVEKTCLHVKPSKNVRCVVPQLITKGGTICFTMRVKKPEQSVKLSLTLGGEEVFKKKLVVVNPANMIEFNLEIPDDLLKTSGDLEVAVDG